MLTRRRFVRDSLTSVAFASGTLRSSLFAQAALPIARHPLRLAILGSVYARGSVMQNLADRFLAGFPWEGAWHTPAVQVVSVYVDQRARLARARPSGYELAMEGKHLAPAGPGRDKRPINAHGERGPVAEKKLHGSGASPDDLSPSRARQFGFLLAHDIPEALRCGGDQLAVDAVLTVVEQDAYPVNDRGEILLPTYDFFQQCAQVFSDEKKTVPYFSYGPLSFSYVESKAMVQTASRMGFPLMAGSAMPLTWRLPDIDLPLGSAVEEAVMVATGNPYMSVFDALEAMQALIDRRKDGETGVKAVQVLEGDEVWAAGDAGRWSKDLLSSALSRSDTPQGLTVLDGRTQDLVASGVLPQLVRNPVACCIEYSDGTIATMLRLDGAVEDFNVALRIRNQNHPLSFQFFLPPPPNNDWSAPLAAKIEHLFRSGDVPYPIERSLLTSGILEESCASRHNLNRRQETPHLNLSYKIPAESQFART